MSLVDFVVNKLDDLKATDILPLNVKGKSSITDTMILCTGTSSRHVSSLAQKLITECKLAGIDVFGDEGKETADWVVVDLGEAIMQAESREMYQLEKLWA